MRGRVRGRGEEGEGERERDRERRMEGKVEGGNWRGEDVTELVKRWEEVKKEGGIIERERMGIYTYERWSVLEGYM